VSNTLLTLSLIEGIAAEKDRTKKDSVEEIRAIVSSQSKASFKINLIAVKYILNCNSQVFRGGVLITISCNNCYFRSPFAICKYF
jgi:hypothetical protein